MATILANMATLDACCVDMTRCNAIELLIRFLHNRPSAYKCSSTQLAACERVQQKTAVALNRLARNPDIAQIIVECGGRYIQVHIQHTCSLNLLNRKNGYLVFALG